ncbi:hypothetical protein [Cryobacterium tepidiphilum]|jgi:hypothetical protein|uniref:Uncharacterized protein n=1 Tax=Cryobacterium tepidiphilum TaxID=2486026 RepID=A0A3M8LE63_9MICO|nr:hypothetical protein [Cryobacterium tepidiphilum]RNE63817.1 hypothetical protein EEJ31_06220 [Cryobacterium tepidiphilum]
MKAIHYAGETVLTGDAIADALVLYAGALARRETAATVDIPVRYPDGTVDLASVLLGPASQMVAIPEHSDADELVDDALVAWMLRQTKALEDPRPQVASDREGTVIDDFDLP